MVDIISSAQNPKVKLLLELQQKSQERRRHGLFVVEGRREIERCLNRGYQIDTIFWCPEIFGPEEPAADGARVFQVSADIYNKVAYRGGTVPFCVLLMPPMSMPSSSATRSATSTIPTSSEPP